MEEASPPRDATTTTTKALDSISINDRCGSGDVEKSDNLDDNNLSSSSSANFNSSLNSTMMNDVAHSRRSRLTVPSGSATIMVESPVSLTSAVSSAASRLTTSGATPRTVPSTPSSASASHRHHLQHLASASGTRPMQYLGRLTDVRQMDVQSALDQMKSLISSRPHVVYKTSYYRKQTKNHWARDDPAFVALQGVFLICACIAYAVAFRATFFQAISFLLYSVIFVWLGAGIVLATVLREIANRHLTVHSSSSHVRQTVEWLYAFDIHCNAFFPAFVVLYAAQFFLLPLVLGEHFLALLVGNALYAIAFSWYWYVTHLGYRTLPFLSNTEVFLFPIAAIGVVYGINLLVHPFGFAWNAPRVMAAFYFG